jgi:hypothetical protein
MNLSDLDAETWGYCMPLRSRGYRGTVHERVFSRAVLDAVVAMVLAACVVLMVVNIVSPQHFTPPPCGRIPDTITLPRLEMQEFWTAYKRDPRAAYARFMHCTWGDQ